MNKLILKDNCLNIIIIVLLILYYYIINLFE
uniref:Uncharacterized protein n=1 Tax=viral metagenome TaxID=1070528 RepID=A0A6C0D6I7_9ZZZZ